MQARPDLQLPTARVANMARVLRGVGWLSLGLQGSLGVAAAIALVSATGISGVLGEEPTPGIGIGIFWAVSGMVVLLVALGVAFRYTRLAQRLLLSPPERSPKSAEVFNALRLGLVLGTVGMLLTLLGSESSLVALLLKATQQPANAVLQNNPRWLVRPLDLFVVAANLHGAIAHFVGAIATLWLFDWLRRQ